MAMKTVQSPDGPCVGHKALEPLAERPQKSTGSFYVHVRGPDRLRDVFLLMEKALEEGYSIVRGGVQTDPHPDFKVLDFFEVYLREEGKREPELAAVVSLYGGSEPQVVKVSPALPSLSQDLIRALSEAVGRMMGVRGGNGERDFDIAVTEGPNR
jgi:hypothetical protein